MNELRRDYLVEDRWAIIAKERGMRPDEFRKEKKAKKPKAKKTCYFCPGNENTTPPEISRVDEKGGWSMRVFPNKFSATTEQQCESEDGLLVSRAAYGRHEVIVETPRHDKSLSDLSVEALRTLMDVYAERIAANMRDPQTAYALVFKNHGDAAGTSLEHSHSQLISLPIVPAAVKAEVEAARRYEKEKGSCPFCDIWKKEMSSERAITEDDHTVAFAPYASRFGFEAWIMPKRHVGSPEFMSPEERASFAGVLKKVLVALDKGLGDPSYNFFLHIAPKDEDFHFHVEVCPRLAKFAGFELGARIIINTMPPEIAAAHYRKTIGKLR